MWLINHRITDSNHECCSYEYRESNILWLIQNWKFIAHLVAQRLWDISESLWDEHMNSSTSCINWIKLFQRYCLWTVILFSSLSWKWRGRAVIRRTGMEKGEGNLQSSVRKPWQHNLSDPSSSWFHYLSSDKIYQWHSAPSHLQRVQTVT